MLKLMILNILEIVLYSIVIVYIVEKWLYHNNVILIWLRNSLKWLNYRLKLGLLCPYCNFLRFSVLFVIIFKITAFSGLPVILDVIFTSILMSWICDLLYGVYNHWFLWSEERFKLEVNSIRSNHEDKKRISDHVLRNKK